MNILFLNPPGTFPFSRDYFCCKVTKGNFIEHPIDFIFLSGWLFQTHRLSFLNSILEGLSPKETLQRIEKERPDILIFLSGSASWKEDFPFLREVKTRLPELRLIGMGDIFLQKGLFQAESWIDAVLFDFTTPDLMHYLDGKLELVKNMCFRPDGKVFERFPEKNSGEFSVPLPRHDLFLNSGYTFPFSRYHPYATVLTDFGCPHSCRFCLYGTFGHKWRNLENVLEELVFCKSLGIREVYFKDQAFGVHASRTRMLCEEMTRLGRFSWSCFMRVDSIDGEKLEAMKRAGCHTIMMGVETANEQILQDYQKKTTPAAVRRAFALCKTFDIQTLGIFILGFPGETEESCRATMQFAIELDCDFASFNIFVPKPGSPIRSYLIEHGLIESHLENPLDQSGLAAHRSLARISDARLKELHQKAIRDFYGRPKYILKHLFRIQTRTQLKSFLKSGMRIVPNFFGGFLPQGKS